MKAANAVHYFKAEDARRGTDTLGSNGRGTRAAKTGMPFVNGLRATQVQEIPLEEISTTDTTFQYRFSCPIGDLRASLSQEGQKEPIDLVGGPVQAGEKAYRVVDGFRRVEAIKALGWTSVKALIHRDISEEDAHKLAFIKNVVRKNLSPMDKANAINLAKQRGRTLFDLAREFNLSEKQIRRYEALLTFPAGIQKLVDKGIVSMGHAKVLSAFQVSDLGPWVQKISEDRISVTGLRRELRTAVGVRPAGRHKVYMKIERSGVRMYPFAISRRAPRDERQKVVGLLKDAIRVLAV